MFFILFMFVLVFVDLFLFLGRFMIIVLVVVNRDDILKIIIINKYVYRFFLW